LIVSKEARNPITDFIGKLVKGFREDFEDAEKALDPTEWRLLFYLGQYPLAALGNPCLDARFALAEICSQGSPHTDVPMEWTGSVAPTSERLDELRGHILDLDPDIAKAVWSILALARAIGFEKQEILQVPWFRFWWLERYLTAVD
jgi:hypothetical protein